jgi:putative RecB family exonuclease
VVEQLDLDAAGLTGVPRRLFSCTPTRLTAWSDCPRRYRMTYVDRPSPPKGPPWAHNSLGGSVHNALRSWYELPPEHRRLEAVPGLVDRTWVADGYRDPDQEADARDWAVGHVRRYLTTQAPPGEPRGVERTVAFVTDRLTVKGRVDRIDERPSRAERGSSELVIVDYKTGRSELGTDQARGSLALALYVLGARRTLRRPCTRVELHHVPTGAVVGWDHSEESLQRHVTRAEAIADEAQAADEAYAVAARADEGAVDAEEVDALYPARPSPACGWCDFVRLCPEGRAVAPSREPWSGLSAELRGADPVGGSGGGKGDEGLATDEP